MNGKSKCKILKEIRKQIAAENDISYVTSECKYKGDCTGTCPKCEAEVRYLEDQLRLRQKAGKAVAVAGIAAAMMVTATGCDLTDILHPATGGTPLETSSYEETENTTDPSISIDIQGDIAVETDPTEREFMGTPLLPETEPSEPLMGDMPLPEE